MLKAANNLNEVFGLPHWSSMSFRMVRNKREMKRAFMAHGVRAVPYRLIEAAAITPFKG